MFAMGRLGKLGVIARAVRGAFTQFLPSSLFGASDQGYWYDNQDLTTMFKDTAGTVPVTAVEQPVALQLDKSKGLELGPNSVVNGDFSSGTAGWIVHPQNTVVGGRLEVRNTSGPFNTRARQDQPFDGAGLYRIRGNIENVSMQEFCTVQSRAISDNAFIAGGIAGSLFPIGSHSFDFSFYASAAFYINVTVDTTVSNAARICYVDNIRCEKIAGNHRIAPGPTTSRPILRQDANGIYYLDTDGADDLMRTAATVDFSGSDKVTLIQALHKRNDTAAVFNELSASSGAVTGGFYTVTGLDVNSLYSSLARGTGYLLAALAARFNESQYPAPDTAIISATHDIAGDLSRIWRNGVVGIDGTAGKGAGNFRNDFVFFYARDGSSSRFNGRDYGQFAISRLLSDAERNQVESWLNTKMGGIY